MRKVCGNLLLIVLLFRGIIFFMPIQTLDNLLTRKQLAAKLNIHVITLDKWVKANKIPVLKIGKGTTRFNESEVAAALLKHSKSPIHA